jgi:hypothetical protein
MRKGSNMQRLLQASKGLTAPLPGFALYRRNGTSCQRIFWKLCLDNPRPGRIAASPQAGYSACAAA